MCKVSKVELRKMRLQDIAHLFDKIPMIDGIAIHVKHKLDHAHIYADKEVSYSHIHVEDEQGGPVIGIGENANDLNTPVVKNSTKLNIDQAPLYRLYRRANNYNLKDYYGRMFLLQILAESEYTCTDLLDRLADSPCPIVRNVVVGNVNTRPDTIERLLNTHRSILMRVVIAARPDISDAIINRLKYEEAHLDHRRNIRETLDRHHPEKSNSDN